VKDPAQHPVQHRHLHCYRFLVEAGEDMLIDYLILDNEKVNPMLLCNQQWFSQKSTTITRTPNVGV
jgi:predicted SAM-dependent methyltransferase